MDHRHDPTREVARGVVNGEPAHVADDDRVAGEEPRSRRRLQRAGAVTLPTHAPDEMPVGVEQNDLASATIDDDQPAIAQTPRTQDLAEEVRPLGFATPSHEKRRRPDLPGLVR